MKKYWFNGCDWDEISDSDKNHKPSFLAFEIFLFACISIGFAFDIFWRQGQ
jgi:hypothetical protein